MSAYVQPETHIAALVRAAYRGPTGTDRPVNPGTVWRAPRWYARDPRTVEWDSAKPGAYFAELAEIHHEVDHESIPRVARMLLEANIASVAHRYHDLTTDELPGSGAELDADWNRLESEASDLTPAEIFKAIDGYEYQACELPTWPDSEAYRFCDALRRAVVHQLPGYDSAGTWTIDARIPA